MTLVGIITLLIVGITLLITPIIPTLIYLLAGKNVFQFCGLFTIIGGVGLLFAPANILRLVLLTRAIKGVGASLPDLHQVPAERQEVPGDSRRDRSTQTGDYRGAPREAGGLHHPRHQGVRPTATRSPSSH
ncbi:MAG TPA: hypothetical protein VF086_02920 [Propionibacteriaceae bacterium]